MHIDRDTCRRQILAFHFSHSELRIARYHITVIDDVIC